MHFDDESQYALDGFTFLVFDGHHDWQSLLPVHDVHFSAMADEHFDDVV